MYENGHANHRAGQSDISPVAKMTCMCTYLYSSRHCTISGTGSSPNLCRSADTTYGHGDSRFTLSHTSNGMATSQYWRRLVRKTSGTLWPCACICLGLGLLSPQFRPLGTSSRVSHQLAGVAALPIPFNKLAVARHLNMCISCAPIAKHITNGQH